MSFPIAALAAAIVLMVLGIVRVLRSRRRPSLAEVVRLMRAGDREGAKAVARVLADQGAVEACMFLGRTELEDGDAVAAVSHLTRAANKGFAAASKKLGDMCLRGEGMAADRGKAMAFYEAAAESGDEEARKILAGMNGGDVRETPAGEG